MPSPADDSFARALGALQAGQIDVAERLFKEALQLDPRHVPALNVYSVVLTQMRRFEEAEQYVRRAIDENPNSDATFYNYGVILKALKRFDEAIAQFNRALSLNGSVPETLNARGESSLELKRLDAAVADFDSALAKNPKLADALINKARALTELEQFSAALGPVDQAAALQPGNALAWLARGRVLNGLNRYEEALESFARALSIQPDLAEAWLGRGASFALLKRPEDARTAFERLIAIKPGDADAWHGHAEALAQLGRNDEAMSAFQKAIALNPEQASAYGGMGTLLMELGKIDQATETFRKGLSLDPDSSVLYSGLVSTKKITADDIAAMETLTTGEAINQSARKRRVLDFALGRAYADTGDHRRAFQHLLAANASERLTFEYNEAEKFAALERIKAIFTPELIAAKTEFGGPSSRPIFIVGMPRSGSTLVEQIFASHPAVEGGGELPTFIDAMNDVVSGADFKQTSYPEFVEELDARTTKAIGDVYLERIDKLALSSKERTTDKMLGNFRQAGLIHIVFPNAIILHTSRNPVDNCVSIFSQNFRDVISYAYDLGELGRYFKQYQGLMAHWHRVLPAGRILDVQYEEVVADLEGQARRIVAHCGLPWDERCLSFHKTERPVRTASVAQVRQPIYSSSVNRWRAYEDYLGPLLKELGVEAQTGG